MRLEGLTCSCLGCHCEDNRDESGPSLSGQAKSTQEFHLSPGSGQRPTRVSSHRSLPASIPFSLPSHQYHTTLLEKAGKEGSTRWVAERDSLEGPRMCGPRGRHSWTPSGCGRRLHLTVHMDAASLRYHLSQQHPSFFMLTGGIFPPDVPDVPHPQLCWLSAFAHTDLLLRTTTPLPSALLSLGDPVQTMYACPSLLYGLLSPHSRTNLQLLHQADHVAICFAHVSTEARCSAFCLPFGF